MKYCYHSKKKMEQESLIGSKVLFLTLCRKNSGVILFKNTKINLSFFAKARKLSTFGYVKLAHQTINFHVIHIS